MDDRTPKAKFTRAAEDGIVKLYSNRSIDKIRVMNDTMYLGLIKPK